MFIDADIGWEPWHLLVMLNHDKDVVGGLYPMKSLPVKWCVNGIPDAVQDDPSGLIEVTKTGTGFLLIKRDVFSKLNAHPAVKPFINDIGLDPALNPYMKTYFDTAVRENRYYSEDWTFCENWRDIGGQVFVDKRVLLKHTGTYVFDYQTQDKLYQDLHQIAMNNQANQPQVVIQQQPTSSDLAAAATPVEATVIATNKKTSEETATA
jgi:hypothetical protein